MFSTIINLAYILPNIYIFFRIGKLFINKGYRIPYAIIYFLIVSIYPYVLFFTRRDYNVPIGILGPISNYFLPFYLYVFLAVFLFDIFLLANLFLKIVAVDKMQSNGFKAVGLASILLASTGIVIAGAMNFNTLQTSEYHIEVPRKSARLDHLRVAFVADFHLSMKTDIRYVERFAAEIERLKPDLMIFGGDIVEGNRQDKNLLRIAKIFKEIDSKYGSYGVLGNHESRSREDTGQFFDQAGIKILSDTIVEIDHAFNLAGRYDNRYSERKSLEELVKTLNDSLPAILIDHRPTDIDQARKTAVDVQLSGHTHNGQLFPLNLILRYMYRLSWGYEKIDHTHFFVTSGIMLWGPPVRTTGKSEIMVINIRFTEK